MRMDKQEKEDLTKLLSECGLNNIIIRKQDIETYEVESFNPKFTFDWMRFIERKLSDNGLILKSFVGVKRKYPKDRKLPTCKLIIVGTLNKQS